MTIPKFPPGVVTTARASGRLGFTFIQGVPVTVFAGLMIAVACAITFALGMPHATIYGHDVFIMLDGAWRVLKGQIPHVDFYSAHGPLDWLLWALGLRLAQGRVEGLLYSTVIAGVLLGFWSFSIFRIRFAQSLALLSLAFLLSFWLSPFPIGEPYYMPSYAMQYNKFGYTVFMILFAELYGVSTDRRDRLVDWGGISSGIALACLLFIKPSFFFAGVALSGFAYLFRLKTLRHAASMAVGLLIVVAAMFSYLGWNIGAYWQDLQIAANARPARFNVVKDVPRTLLRNLPILATLFGMAILGISYKNRDTRNSAPCLHHPVLLMLLIFACDLILAVTNSQRFGFPLSTLAVLLYGSQVYLQQESQTAQGRRSWVMLLMVVTVLPSIGDTLNAWAIQVTTRRNTVLADAARIDAQHMASLVFDDHNDPVWGQSEANGHLLSARVNEGIDLLKRNSSPDMSVFCLCYANPFPYALGRPPAKGGSPFFDYSTNFTERFAPSPERILGDADLIIYPKLEATWTTVGTLLQLCGPLLAQKYKPLAESRQWVLLKRRSTSEMALAVPK